MPNDRRYFDYTAAILVSRARGHPGEEYTSHVFALPGAVLF